MRCRLRSQRDGHADHRRLQRRRPPREAGRCDAAVPALPTLRHTRDVRPHAASAWPTAVPSVAWCRRCSSSIARTPSSRAASPTSTRFCAAADGGRLSPPPQPPPLPPLPPSLPVPAPPLPRPRPLAKRSHNRSSARLTNLGAKVCGVGAPCRGGVGLIRSLFRAAHRAPGGRARGAVGGRAGRNARRGADERLLHAGGLGARRGERRLASGAGALLA